VAHGEDEDISLEMGEDEYEVEFVFKEKDNLYEIPLSSG